MLLSLNGKFLNVFLEFENREFCSEAVYERQKLGTGNEIIWNASCSQCFLFSYLFMLPIKSKIHHLFFYSVISPVNFPCSLVNFSRVVRRTKINLKSISLMCESSDIRSKHTVQNMFRWNLDLFEHQIKS